MKIALIPSLVIKSNGVPIPFIPIGLLNIIGCLKRDGNSDIHLIDLNCLLQQRKQSFSVDFYDYATNSLLDSNYDIVGLSTSSTSFHHVISIAKRLKEQDERIITIVGGPGPQTPSLAPFILKAFPCIDYLISGEGEIVLPKLIYQLNQKKVPLNLPGVYFKFNDKVIINKPSELVENLDDLPFPDFISMNVKNYVYSYKNSESIIHIEQGRGCPFNCTYCSTCIFWHRYPRRKSASRVLEEMDIMNKLYSLDTFSLINDCFNSDQKYVLEFCRQFQLSKKAYFWGCSLRADHTTKDMLDKLWKAGCRAFFAGIESGSRRIQRLINKNLDLNHVINILEYASKKGFHVRTSFIIGFPEETRDDLNDTMKLHKECLDVGVKESHVNLLTPLHGSQMLESGKYNLLFDGHGSTLNNNIVLDEHVDDIQKYPKIFSPFYYFEPFHIHRKEFIEDEILCNLLTNQYL